MSADGIRISRATADEREDVLGLVERLLAELEEHPEEFAGLDRSRTLRDLEAAVPSVVSSSPPEVAPNGVQARRHAGAH